MPHALRKLSLSALLALFPLASCQCPSTGGEGEGEGEPGEGEGEAGEGEGEGEGEGGDPDAGIPPVIDEPDPEDPDNGIQDADCDGISDEDEFGDVWPGGGRTDPANWDSDDDGVADGVEAGRTEVVDERCPFSTLDLDPSTITNPTFPDSDADCISDGDEDHNSNGRVDAGETDPDNDDTDGDGLGDGEEDDGAGIEANACNGVLDPGESDPQNGDSDGDGLSDGLEDLIGTDPNDPDSDGDGVPDGVEYENGDDPLLSPLDSDADGIDDDVEIARGWDPNDPDMDNDGLCDGPRTVVGVCRTGEDLDRDGQLDPGESDPQSVDSDCDGLGDSDEVSLTTNALDDDTDGDGLMDGLETGAAVSPEASCLYSGDQDPTTTTDPLALDSDGDGNNDGVEDLDRDGALAAANPGGQQETNAADPDTDDDGFCDGDGTVAALCVAGEDRNGDGRVSSGETDPRVPDTDLDADGLTDLAEVLLGTNATDPDTDGDGLCDGPLTVGGVCAAGEDINSNGARDLGETNALEPDSDCDAVSDGAELLQGINALDFDTDNDGLRDGVELSRTATVAGSSCAGVVLDSVDSAAASASNPADSDSDNDGIPDGVEDRDRNGAIAAATVSPRETFPNNADSDGDGRCDGALFVQGVCVAGEDFDGNGIVEAGETDPRLAEFDADGDGLLSTIETVLGTSDSNADSDGDGLCDGALAVGACIAGEDMNRNGSVNANETSPTQNDSDCDALNDREERTLGTNALDADSDNDLLTDGLELGRTVRLGCATAPIDSQGSSTTNPLLADSDTDGINDGTEDRDRDGALDPVVANPLTTVQETDPNDADTEGDGKCDGAIAVVAAACTAGEDINRNGIVDGGETDPRQANQDLDGDGLDDAEEGPLYGTNPNDADTDNDGLLDGEEVLIGLTDPLRADTDCDGLNDGDEVDLGTDPFEADSDGDGLTDGLEAGTSCAAGGANPETDAVCNAAPAQCIADADAGTTTTDPIDADSDGDGVDDGAEDANQDGDVDPGELNPGNPGDVGGADANACSAANLKPVTLLDRPGSESDLTLGVGPSFASTTVVDGQGDTRGAFLYDAQKQLAGAAFATTTLSGATPLLRLNALETILEAQGDIAAGTTERQTFTSWDGHDAIIGKYVWTDAQAGDVVTKSMRDLTAAVAPGLVSSPALGTGTDVGPYVLQVAVLMRASQNDTVVLIGLGNQADMGTDERAFFRLDDHTNGSTVATFGDDVGVQCDRFSVVAPQKVDFVLVIDNSGSMDNEQNAVAAAAAEIGTRLSSSTVDWRIAVITSDLDGLANNVVTEWGTCEHPQLSTITNIDDSGAGDTVVVTTAAVNFYDVGESITIAGVDGGGATYNGTYTVAARLSPTQFRTTEVDPGGGAAGADPPRTVGTVNQVCASANSIVTGDTAYCEFTTSTTALAACVDDLNTAGAGGENAFRPLACALGRQVTGAGVNSENGNMCGRNQNRPPYAGTALYAQPPAGFVLLPREVNNARKLRTGAALAVIFITDAPEQSDDRAGNTTSLPAWQSFFNNYDGAGSAAFVAGIVCPNGTNCSDDNQTNRFTTFFANMGGVERALPNDTVANQAALIQEAIAAILDASIANASPYVLTKPPVSSTIKVATDAEVFDPAGCEASCEAACVADGETAGTCATRCSCGTTGCTEIPRSANDGFDYDGVNNAITFVGDCRPRFDQIGDRIAVSYRYWIEDLIDEPECNCPDPFVCVNQQCLCPADCGGGLGAGETCDAVTCAPVCLPDCGGCPGNQECNTGSCSCACEAGCGGNPPGPGFVCDDQGPTATCEWVCDDCGGVPPGNATCNTNTCALECAGCPGGDIPAGQFCNTNPNVCAYDCLPDCGGCLGNATCNTNTCACTCPADCGGPAPSPNHTCDLASCTYTCALPPAGSQPPRADYTWDPIACDWVCPDDCGDAVSPGPNAVCDTTTCEFFCPADCGGCEGSGVCDTNSCRCECPSNCGSPQPSPDHFCNGECAWECSTTPTSPSPGPGFEWDAASCSWQCADDCGVTNIDPGYFCNLGTCAVECRADCGGCAASETCDTASCTCTCDVPTTCAPGFVFDTQTCGCVCDLQQSCPATHNLNPDTCACECGEDQAGEPDCNGCGAGTLCQPSLCECRPIGG